MATNLLDSSMFAAALCVAAIFAAFRGEGAAAAVCVIVAILIVAV